MKYYLAIDIGASGGRHILGHISEDGKLVCEEVYRFPNGIVERNGSLCWDFDGIFAEILKGMKLCAELGKVPESVGIDTWGVDFVLLDDAGAIIGDTIAYRDNRTDGMMEKVFGLISEKDLYSRTGTAMNVFNTIFQFMAVRDILPKARHMLLVPDYLHYLLSGKIKTEYSIASTTGLLNAQSKDWDWEVIRTCGYPDTIFGEIVMPGTLLGNLLPKLVNEIGYSTKIITPASHDTASAVMAVPSGNEGDTGTADSIAYNNLYISSGTWSLMGVERLLADCSSESLIGKFTNEGGYNAYRYLRNIMGLWMIQSVKAELAENESTNFSYTELCEMAEQSNISSIVDCDDQRFFAPASMSQEIRLACKETGQAIPVTTGELAAVVYNSLASCYRNSVETLEKITNITYPAINIVGGGANAGYLNRLTAEYTGKIVLAGPTEATAIGNLLAQMIADGIFSDLQTARACVKASFDIE